MRRQNSCDYPCAPSKACVCAAMDRGFSGLGAPSNRKSYIAWWTSRTGSTNALYPIRAAVGSECFTARPLKRDATLSSSRMPTPAPPPKQTERRYRAISSRMARHPRTVRIRSARARRATTAWIVRVTEFCGKRNSDRGTKLHGRSRGLLLSGNGHGDRHWVLPA